MNTALSWIKAYVPDLDVTAQEYTDAMTLSGTKVEGYEKLDKNLWFALKDRPPIIAEAVDFLKSVKNAPDINFDRENIYIAPLFIRKYEYVTDATLLVYDASDGRIYYLDCNT